MLSRISIRSKIFLIAILFALSLASLIALFFHYQDRQSALVADIVGNDFPQVVEGGELLQLMAQTQSDMLNGVILKTLGRGDAEIAALGSAIEARTTRIADAVRASGQRLIDLDAELPELIETYTDGAGVAIDLAQSNVGMAMPIVAAATAKFNIVWERLEKLRIRSIRNVDERVAEHAALSARMHAQTGLLSLVAFAVSLAACLWIGQHLTRAIGRTESAMAALAEGRLDVTVEGTDRRDEIGRMAKALEVFVRNARTLREMEEQRAGEELRNQQHQKALVQEVSSRIERVVEETVRTLVRASTDMTGSADQMTRQLDEQGDEAEALAQASRTASGKIVQIVRAIDGLNESITLVGQQSARGQGVALQAVTEAGDVDAKIVHLNDAAARIEEVVGIISTIAAQTNLLALNATIEAARAGEAGKGFAVVASEVKALAVQTAQATDDIREQVVSMQAVVGGTVTAMRGIGQTIGSIRDVIEAVSHAVAEQTHYTREVARVVQAVESDAGAVATRTMLVSQTLRTTSGDAANVLDRSREVLTRTNRLMENVSTLLTELRQGEGV